MGMKQFAEYVVYDLWNKPYGKGRQRALVLDCDEDDDFYQAGCSAPAVVTPGSQIVSRETIRAAHVLVKTERKEGGKRDKDRLQRRLS